MLFQFSSSAITLEKALASEAEMDIAAPPLRYKQMKIVLL